MGTEEPAREEPAVTVEITPGLWGAYNFTAIIAHHMNGIEYEHRIHFDWPWVGRRKIRKYLHLREQVIEVEAEVRRELDHG